MKIYTKSGDQGLTGLLGGMRVAKSDPRIELLGTLDELNSVLGLAASMSPDQASRGVLERTQRQLFALGAELAQPESKKSTLREQAEAWTIELEREIDQKTERLPPLVNFILPGGSPTAATIHLARSVCRRTERTYFGHQPSNVPWIGIYLNRLGDWLFVLARWVNHLEGKSESIWKAGSE